MKTTERFTNAVTKLYNAFHQNRLNAFDCKACAVGNICNNDPSWSHVIDSPPISSINFAIEYYSDKSHNCTTKATGYSLIELAHIEGLFVDYSHESEDKKTDEFNGLCAVVEYLCELDGIPNVMDYTCLFETENNQPKHELCLV